MSKPPLSEDEKLIIVPDACTLAYWAAPIPQRYFTPEGLRNPDRPKHFYDLLKYLPRDKFKAVHVLDIVGAEALGRDADGKMIDPDHEKRGKALKAPDLEGLAEMLYGEKKDPFFQIVHTTAGSALIDLHKKFHELNGTLESYLSTFDDAAKADEIRKATNKEMRKTRKATCKDGGETVVCDYLLKEKNPTFFISDEKGARKRVVDACEKNQHGCIYVDHTVGFLEALTGYSMDTKVEPEKGHNLLAEKCGFKNAVRPKEMFLFMSDYDNPHQALTITPSQLETITSKDSKEPPAPGEWVR